MCIGAVHMTPWQRKTLKQDFKLTVCNSWREFCALCHCLHAKQVIDDFGDKKLSECFMYLSLKEERLAITHKCNVSTHHFWYAICGHEQTHGDLVVKEVIANPIHDQSQGIVFLENSKNLWNEHECKGWQQHSPLNEIAQLSWGDIGFFENILEASWYLK